MLLCRSLPLLRPRLWSKCVETRSLAVGKACPDATMLFIKKSGLPLFHVFDRTNLVSSPIIQGPFDDFDDSIDHETILEVMQHSISNKINSFVVYAHKTKQSPLTYAMPHMNHLIKSNLIKRNEFLAIADLGVIGKDEDIMARLDEAKKLTDLENIDLAYIQINDDVLMNERLQLQSHMQALERVCQKGGLQGWGARVSIAPYNLHKPMPQKVPGDKNFFFPLMFESLTATLPHLSFVLYPLSPSSALPPTYPLMNEEDDAGDEVVEEGEIKLGGDEGVFRGSRGVGSANKGRKGGEKKDTNAQEGDMGNWEEIDMALVDDMKNQERVISRIAHNPLVCYRAHPISSVTSQPPRPPRSIQEAIARLDDIEEAGKGSSDALSPPAPLILISNLLAPADEDAVHSELNRLCPPLKSSKSLEDKAFRIVTSLHVDVCMVDAEYCAALGKWAVKGGELLTEVDTEALVEGFEVPP